MKAITIYVLTLLLIAITTEIFAQGPVKQYCGGNNGVIQKPSKALSNGLMDYSTLKLKPVSAKKDFVYQNFVFNPETSKNCKVVFVIQTNEKLNMSTMPNLKFYTTDSYNVVSDTMSDVQMQINQVNEKMGLYEFSFVPQQDFQAAGVLLQGGGIIQMAKIYKVYMAINDMKPAAFSIVSAKK
jgi:hypothetical protein